MKEINKVFRYELKKIQLNKPIIIIFAIIIIVMLVAPAINFYKSNKTQSQFLPDRENVLIQYQKELNQYKDILASNAYTMKKQDKEIYITKCKKLRFYLDTNTIESDYLNSSSLESKVSGRQNVGFMFYFGQFSSFFLWAFAIILSAYLFVAEYLTHSFKNVMASRISRRNIFAGKLLLLFTLTTSVFVVFTLYALFFGLTQRDTNLLVLHNTQFRAIGAIPVFLTQSIATYIIMLTFSAVAVISGVAFKNIAISIASTCSLYGISLLMVIALESLVFQKPEYLALNYYDKMPILSLQFHIGGFDNIFIISAFLHIVFFGLVVFFANRIFKKQDL